MTNDKVKRTSVFMTSAEFAEKKYPPLTHADFGMTAAQRQKLTNLNASEPVSYTHRTLPTTPYV